MNDRKIDTFLLFIFQQRSSQGIDGKDQPLAETFSSYARFNFAHPILTTKLSVAAFR